VGEAVDLGAQREEVLAERGFARPHHHRVVNGHGEGPQGENGVRYRVSGTVSRLTPFSLLPHLSRKEKGT